MSMNHKWAWIAGAVALVGVSFLLRKKAANLWRRAMERREGMETAS